MYPNLIDAKLHFRFAYFPCRLSDLLSASCFGCCGAGGMYIVDGDSLDRQLLYVGLLYMRGVLDIAENGEKPVVNGEIRAGDNSLEIVEGDVEGDLLQPDSGFDARVWL